MGDVLLNDEVVKKDILHDAGLERLIERDGNLILQHQLTLYGFDVIKGFSVEDANDLITRARTVANNLFKSLFVEHLKGHFDSNQAARCASKVQCEGWHRVHHTIGNNVGIELALIF